MVSSTIILLVSVAVGLALQWLVYALVQRPQWLAEPDERSSHTRPTPTMGGLGIVGVVVGYMMLVSEETASFGWPFILALIGLAAIGLWDDLKSLSARIRIVVHFVAAFVVLWSFALDLPLAMLVILTIALVWFINLFNFMDGIDGYAAIQTLVFCLGAQWVGNDIPGWSGELLWVLAGSSLAFLAFNWPPAKIFMGDVGSGFLGLLIGALVLYLWAHGFLPLISSLILLAGFWFDATYTLCMRVLTRQKFTQAHRSHLYQHLAQGRGHLWTSVVFMIYGLCWLLPLAWLAASWPYSWLEGYAIQVLLLSLSIVPIGIACWRFDAGSALVLASSSTRPLPGEKE